MQEFLKVFLYPVILCLIVECRDDCVATANEERVIDNETDNCLRSLFISPCLQCGYYLHFGSCLHIPDLMV